MNFKVGDRVWIDNPKQPSGSRQIYPPGIYPATIVELAPVRFWGDTCWWCDAEALGGKVGVPEGIMRPRYDPPPQQEPKHESVGNWDSCVWKPAVEEVEC